MMDVPTDPGIARFQGQKSRLQELEQETQVWCVHLSAEKESLQRALSLLSPEERTRCDQFRLELLQHRYTVARAALRTLLSAYLDVPAEDLRFVSGNQGKPFLQDQSSRMQFNLAHSGDLCVLAFTLDSDVGVDVERIRPVRDAAAVAKRFFAKEECEDLLRTPAAERDRVFFRCWTRKEAFVKAVGDGLSFPLDRFRVSLDDAAALLHVDGGVTEAESWGLHDLPAEPGYAGALAVRNRTKSVRVFPTLAAGELIGNSRLF